MSNKVCFEYQLHRCARCPGMRAPSLPERYRLLVAADPDDGDGPSATMTLLLELPGPTGEPQWVDISDRGGAHRIMAPVLLRMLEWARDGRVDGHAHMIRENAHGVRFVNLGLLSYE